MPYRRIVLAQNEIYHIFNRGVARLPIYTKSKDYSRFLDLIDYYRFSNLPVSFSGLKKLPLEDRENILNKIKQENNIQVRILALCLMPNHFHLLLQQVSSEGISTFMRKLQNSYVKYYNLSNNRDGPLYQSAFKAVRVESDEQLIHLSRYIHLNPSTAYMVKADNLKLYPWSSLPHYINDNVENYSFITTEIILSNFKTKKAYKQFVYDQIDYQRELHNIHHLLLD